MAMVRTWALRAGLILTPLLAAGCFPILLLAPFTCDQPWVTERMEDKFAYRNDKRTSILPPIREGFPPPLCEDPPDEARVLRAIPHLTRGVPYFYEEFRDDIDVVSERLVDKIDPPRFFPLVGPAQLHHCHWKCTVYYTETIESGYPFPFRCRRPRVEVVYVDLDHLHLYPGKSPDAIRSVTRDLTNN